MIRRFGIFVIAFYATTTLAKNVSPSGGAVAISAECSVGFERLTRRYESVIGRNKIASIVTHIERLKPDRKKLARELPPDVVHLVEGTPGVKEKRIWDLVSKTPNNGQAVDRAVQEFRELRRQYERQGEDFRDPEKVMRLAAGYIRFASVIDSPETLSDLRHKFRMGRVPRTELVSRLAALDNPRVVWDLQRSARDKDPRVARQARLGLLLRGESVKPYLDAIEEDIREHFRLPHGEQIQNFISLQEELTRLPDKMMEKLINRGALNRISNTLSSDVFQQRSIQWIREQLAKSRSNEFNDVRALLVMALQQRFDPHARSELIKAVDDPSEKVRMAALEVMEDMSDQWARETLTRLKEESRFKSVREAAQEKIINIIAARERAYARWDDPEERDLSEVPLANHFYDKPLKDIEEALSSPNPVKRHHAAIALFGRKNPQAQALIKHAFEDPVLDVRLAALSAALTISTPKMDKLVQAASRDTRSEMYEKVYEHFSAQPESPLVATLSPSLQTALKMGQYEIDRQHRLGGAETRLLDQDRTGLEAATHVYEIPNPEYVKTPEALVEAYLKFKKSSPAGHEVKMAISDPSNGTRVAYYAPMKHLQDAAKGEKSRPRVLSIAGTQNLTDWLSNLNFARSQRESIAMEKAIERAVSDLIEGKDVNVVGHSQGGGIAQWTVLEIRERLKQATQRQAKMLGKLVDAPDGIDPDFGKVRGVTAAAFGVKQDVARDQRFSDEDVREAEKVIRNYYLKGDPVSRLGEHIGETKKLPDVKSRNPVTIHRTASFEQAAIFDGGLEKAESTSPKRMPVVSWLIPKTLGFLGEMGQRMRFSSKARPTLEMMLKAKEMYVEREGYKKLDEDNWLEAEIESLIAQATGPEQQDFRRLQRESERRRRAIEQQLRHR